MSDGKGYQPTTGEWNLAISVLQNEVYWDKRLHDGMTCDVEGCFRRATELTASICVEALDVHAASIIAASVIVVRCGRHLMTPEALDELTSRVPFSPLFQYTLTDELRAFVA